MAVALDVAVILDLHRARPAHAAQVVAAEIDEHQVLGEFLLVGQQFLLQEKVFLLGVTAPPGAGDRVRGGAPVLDGDERLGAGSHDREVQSPIAVRDVEQVHVRAGVGHPQHPVDIQRVRVGVHLEALGRHHLEGLTGLDVADQLVDDLRVLLHGQLRAMLRGGPAERRHGRGQRLGQRRGHHIQPRDGVVIGLVDALVGAVPVHRVRDQRDRALVVVDGGDVGGQQQHHVRQPEVVDRQLRQPLQPAHHVVGEEPDQARRQRRQTGQRGGLQQRQRRPQRLQRVTARGGVLRDDAEPYRLAVAHRQSRRCPRADERPARPRPPVLRGLQQERSGPVGGQLAIRRQRRLAVGEHLAGHRDHAMLGGQRPEVLPRGRHGQVGGRLHAAILPDVP